MHRSLKRVQCLIKGSYNASAGSGVSGGPSADGKLRLTTIKFTLLSAPNDREQLDRWPHAC